MTKTKKKKSPRSPTKLDDFLKDDGKLEERMKTSRSQIGRSLDPKDGNVTLATLQRAARMVGRSLRLELI
jgi:hypothetical protein